ncbi:MAG: phage holin family protein, partial [Nitrospinae bacterium]|nr:phage holin family protein [Nitrospinota bacterium]
MIMRLLISWVLSGAAFLGLSKILPGFRVGSFTTALVVAAVYSVLHLVVYVILFKVLWVLTIIPVVLTFGLLYFVV